MPITTADLKNQVQHALGGSPSDQISELLIINQAGRHMFSHGWKFRARPTVNLTIVAGTDYVSLPADVGSIISLRMKDGLNDSIELTSYDYVLMIRNGDISTGAHYYATVVWPAPYINSSGAAQSPRLELAPNPIGTDTIVLAYRAGWSDLDLDADIAQVPAFAEALLIAYVRAFALGYEEEGMAVRLAELEASSLFERVAVQDGLLQPNYGEIKGGMVSRNREAGRLPFNTLPDS